MKAADDTNPLANLPAADQWAASLPTVDSWAANLAQPYDDVPSFDSKADPEVDTAIRLDGDKRLIRTPSRRLFQDYRSQPDAYAHLNPLPGPGESLHGVISGKFALADLIPALIESAGPIDTLHIATLSFNAQNAKDLLQMLDDGQIGSVGLLISYYYKSTSREIYDLLVPQLRERGHRVLAMRTHAKILLAKMRNGTSYVCESSANLRSSINVEQFVLTNDRPLYDFHRTWIDDLLDHGQELGK